MERGTEWERAAVRERWAELEERRGGADRRRAARRLLAGAALLLWGLVFIVVSLPREACMDHRPWPQGCVAIVPVSTEALLLVGGPVAVVSGLLLCWRAVAD